MSGGAGAAVAGRPPQHARQPPQPPPQRRGARALIGPYALLWFYRRWLRTHAVQELLAGAGVAIAVALVFATIVAGASISGSTAAAVHTVSGPATLQLHARGAQGIDERLALQAQRLPGVKAAVPLLEESAFLRGGGGRSASVDLAGAGLNLVFMDGLSRTIPRATLTARGIGLSARTAAALGIAGGRQAPASERVRLQLRGRSFSIPVSAVLGHEAFGALAGTGVAVMRLGEMQRLAGMRGRVTRILVQPRRGRRAAVGAELRRLAGGGIEVAAATQDVSLLEQALRPSDQASGLFATVSALLGVLLASAAMLLTAPDRRRAIAELRLMGMRRSAIVEMVLLQALLLGVAASAVGIAGGFALSRTVLHTSSRYLAEAFTLGTQTTPTSAALSFALLAGLAGTCLASATPLLDLRRPDPLHGIYESDGVPGNALGSAPRTLLAAAALALLAAATALLALAPSRALLACVLLALASVCAMPVALSTVIGLARIVSERWQQLTVLPVALSSLEATTVRSLALAGTGALALFGSIALGGARADLAAGISGFAHSYASDAPIWVATPGDDQGVADFAAGGVRARLAALPGVGEVAELQGGFAELDGRRAWILARPPGYAAHVLASQLIAGARGLAERRLAAGGWAVLSRQIAQQQHTGVGGTIVLPTPSGTVRLRIAALSTNLAWSPGAILLGEREYRRLWHTVAPTALAVTPRPGASVGAVEARVRAALRGSGLTASTSATLQRSIETLAGEGLERLQEISTLLAAAAALAMAAALASAIWQRRTALAGLRLCGVSGGRLRRILLTEAVLMLGAGCVTGALAGVYGQAVIDGYLRNATGFPVASIAAEARPLAIFALVVVIAAALAAAPILAASRVSPAIALETP
ncbi:MAG: FtsX-like permease family protein [Solirubrobacteraceae bacterium]